jgi:DegV family protein with EDD domain
LLIYSIISAGRYLELKKMRIKVVTDSACDVPEELIKQFDITVVPNYINIGNQSFRDGIDITRNQFYEGLPTFPQHPKTAAPGPELFVRAYQNAVDQGYDQVISIHVAGNLSSTFQSTIQASNQAKIPVTLHDSKQLSLGAGLQVILASKMAAAGENVKEIKQKITEHKGRNQPDHHHHRPYLCRIVVKTILGIQTKYSLEAC